MKKLILFAIIALFSTNIMAQREETIIGDSGWSFSGAWGGWSYNFASFDKNYSSYNGGLWALEFGKRLTVGYWHYDLANQNIGTNKSFSSYSKNLHLGYSIASYKAVHPIFSLGMGQSRINATGNTESNEARVWTFHPAVGLELNATRWCHIDAQVGYRAVTGTKFVGFNDADFSGLYGSVSLKFGFSWGRYKTKMGRDKD
jgi:Outer membrane protein beta-barrel domain